jgi:hypothetical protein
VHTVGVVPLIMDFSDTVIVAKKRSPLA